MHGHGISKAGRLLLLAVVLGVSNLYAQDPPGGGGDTNGVPVTNNFIAQPYPLNLITTCLSVDPAGSLSSLADLDSAVATGYGQLTNYLMVIYPPGIYSIPVDGGLFTFSTNGEIAANIGMFQPVSFMGFSLWKMGVLEETQLTVRSWVYMGASDGTNSVAFRTNAVTGFDPQAWVRTVYKENPPSYLTGDALSQWYSARDRSRAVLGVTLIKDSDLSALQAAIDASRENTTNIPSIANPTMPADTNRVAFAGIAGFSADGRLGLWIYSPINNLPVDVLTRSTLTSNMLWQLIGTINASYPFTLWYAPPGTSATAFFDAARADIDSDGDGIPDDRELLVFGTNPYAWDSAGTSLGDYARALIYGLSANNRDSNGDGMDDDESILAGIDPNGSGTAPAPTSIRFYFDADDRVAGAFTGSSPSGASLYQNSPAGNQATTTERILQ